MRIASSEASGRMRDNKTVAGSDRHWNYRSQLSAVAECLAINRFRIMSNSKRTANFRFSSGCVLIVAVTLVLTLAIHSATGAAGTVKIHGYVTDVRSHRTFYVEDHRIVRHDALAFELVREDSDSVSLSEFAPEDLRVGLEVAVTGTLTPGNHEIHATSIRVFQEELRAVRRTALLERAPVLDMTPDGWSGDFFADGQVIRVSPFTVVDYKPNQSERRALKQKRRGTSPRMADARADGEDVLAQPLRSLDEIGPNTFLTYEGMREEDGSIAATHLSFTRNELQPNEQRFQMRLRPVVKESDYEKRKPGRLSIGWAYRFKLVPSEEAQNYLRRLGESLIPDYQRNLRPDDPEKTPFQFFLVKGAFPNAFATPNGVIVVFSSLIELLQNEAQLAFVLSHEIAHAIQEHTRQQMEHKRGERIALKLGSIAASAFGVPVAPDIMVQAEHAIVAGYSRKHENQADRIGLEYVVANGYDPREAARVWEILAKSTLQTPAFFWASHENNTKRRSYLMAELRNNYPKLDYSSYVRDTDAFQEFVRNVKDAHRKRSR